MLPPRAYIFFGLNAVRALSIVSLLLVFASSIFVMTKDVQAFHDFQAQSNSTSYQNCDYIPNSDVPNQPAGIFWAVINRILIMLEVIALILSEVGWPYAFFNRFFPVLGSEFGLGPLGIFEGLIGATILSHHVDDFTLVAAFFLFALGCVNMLLGLIFRERAKERRCIFAWRERAKDVLPTSKLPGPLQAPAEKFVDDVFNGNWKGGATEFGRKKAGFGFGRQGEKQAGLKGFLISKPLETLPRYAVPPRPGTPSTTSSRSATPEPRFKSSPIAI
ncbi:uncharacterized protein C8Q71DRAFT_775501 [Rhodofomes roseus]|uniref:DUF7598 domain-containing protein n=1 Tax=Rhodofomes roseus TaxID=34475 RepID=A0ABQ8K7X7_9APHY|nr:uncharacterized protein C8Q71DRAFT_775501 [Rhodofomes roseus]KAH9832906.1 hypothetical protein C8Q71DRAFT_775501 [Rhodofomes roseus]